MTKKIINIPDLGEAEDVEVIEICVKAGDQVDSEDPIIVLESDKAAMEIPASVVGKVISIEVSVGDTVSSGSPGYGATSDGHDMVAPSGEGGERSMKLAVSTIGERSVNYINAHGTSTPAGDVTEVEAVRRVFAEKQQPVISSTKSLTGHSLGATGVQEAIYSLIMLDKDFITASANISELDPALNANEIATKRVDNAGLDTVLSNSFGFGGTNASLAMSKYNG